VCPLLQAGVSHRIVYSDIDAGADVEVFCDAQDMAFAEEVFDAVIAMPVLAHVFT